MPIYRYECSYCMHEFDEIRDRFEKSGRSYCTKCGNTAYKIPATFVAKIFKERKFHDDTSTPHFVNTPKQEKEWMRAEGITYDPPAGNELRRRKEEKKIKANTAMGAAFKSAVEKCEGGFIIENPKDNRRKA